MSKNLNFFLTALVATIFLGWGINVSQENLEDFFYAQISQPFVEISLVKIPPKSQKPKPELQIESALSVKINKFGKQKVVFRKDAVRSLPIASLTKLMTGLIVLENTTQDDFNFSRAITISKEAANQNDVPVYGNLKQGEVFTVKKLLRLMLAYSSNDAAFALSDIVDNKGFIERMNQKAKDLGIENTYFVNSSGLDPQDPKQIPNYSTSQDLMTLAKYILVKYPLIFELSLSQEPYPTQNGLSDLSLPEEQRFIGGKTGYTEKAGGCMLSIIQDEKQNHFINVILGTDSPIDRVKEMQKLIDWLNT